jgi:hypothetical protein
MVSIISQFMYEITIVFSGEWTHDVEKYGEPFSGGKGYVCAFVTFSGNKAVPSMERKHP